MLRRLLNFFRTNRLEEDFREELEFHRAQTNGSLGNFALTQDRMRDASTIQWLETAWQDVRYGVRQLCKSPVFLGVAVLSLALGIGANTAIFTMINAIMLQSLPVREPARLVLFNDALFQGTSSGQVFPGDTFSYAAWRYQKEHNDTFEDLCAFKRGADRMRLHVAGEPQTRTEDVEVHLVSGNYFDVFGVGAAVGRVLRSADDSSTATPTAVLSYDLWRDRFHLDSAIVGKQVVLNGTAFTIAGSLRGSFSESVCRLRRTSGYRSPSNRASFNENQA
jgi:hypothetical protein